VNLKNAVRRIPFAAKLHKALTAPVRSRSNPKILKQLGETPYPQGAKLAWVVEQLAQGLSTPDAQSIERIEAERRRLLDRDDLLVDGSLGEGCLHDRGVRVCDACAVSKAQKPALMLYWLVRALEPQRVLELGTNVGVSSSYLATALEANSKTGRLMTLEVSQYRQRLASEVHANLGLDNVSYSVGLFADRLAEAMDEMGEIDLAFIDGHHSYQPTLDYFDAIFKHSAEDAVFVFDDIRWSPGMKQAWSEIRSDERLGLVVDFHSVGVCVRRRGSDSRRHVLRPLYVL
jgi:predicted O-methyltransferase YrrM